MMTKSSTTYILLERGAEDVKLLSELRQIIRETGLGTKALAEKYPLILELKYVLECEIEKE